MDIPLVPLCVSYHPLALSLFLRLLARFVCVSSLSLSLLFVWLPDTSLSHPHSLSRVLTLLVHSFSHTVGLLVLHSWFFVITDTDGRLFVPQNIWSSVPRTWSSVLFTGLTRSFPHIAGPGFLHTPGLLPHAHMVLVSLSTHLVLVFVPTHTHLDLVPFPTHLMCLFLPYNWLFVPTTHLAVCSFCSPGFLFLPHTSSCVRPTFLLVCFSHTPGYLFLLHTWLFVPPTHTDPVFLPHTGLCALPTQLFQCYLPYISWPFVGFLERGSSHRENHVKSH